MALPRKGNCDGRSPKAGALLRDSKGAREPSGAGIKSSRGRAQQRKGTTACGASGHGENSGFTLRDVGAIAGNRGSW